MTTKPRSAGNLRVRSVGAAATAVYLAALLLGGVQAEANAATAASAATRLLARWDEIGRKLIAIAEDLPEDKYGYKPHPDARSFVDQLLHAAGAMASFTDRVEGRAERYPCDPTGSQLKTRAEVVAFVRQGVREGAALLRDAGEEGLHRPVKGAANDARLEDLANEMIEHSGEHYGQLVVYYRINGLVPPESR